MSECRGGIFPPLHIEVAQSKPQVRTLVVGVERDCEQIVSKRKIAEIHVVPQNSVVTAPYRMEQVGGRMEEGIGKDASLLKKALQAKEATERAAALKKYLEEAEDPDYATVAKALKDTDPKVRKVALQGMEDSNSLPFEATAEGGPHGCGACLAHERITHTGRKELGCGPRDARAGAEGYRSPAESPRARNGQADRSDRGG